MAVDPYVDPDTNVLRNRLNLRDASALEQAEADFTHARAVELVEMPIAGGFDLAHLQAVHRHLFQDTYEWAGELRTVAIAKSDLFCLPQHIEAYAATVFGELAADNHLAGLTRRRFIERAAHHLANVNALHPFRDGNGRAQRAFFARKHRRLAPGVGAPPPYAQRPGVGQGHARRRARANRGDQRHHRFSGHVIPSKQP